MATFSRRQMVSGAALALIGGLILSAPSYAEKGGKNAEGSGATSIFTTVTGAAEQSTSRGKTIGDLALVDGQLYVGYGDYGANTGPINMYSYDALTGEETLQYTGFLTEEVNTLRVIDGSVYAPAIDPRVSWTANVGYLSN